MILIFKLSLGYGINGIELWLSYNLSTNKTGCNVNMTINDKFNYLLKILTLILKHNLMSSLKTSCLNNGKSCDL